MRHVSDDIDGDIEPPHGGRDGALFALIVVAVSVVGLIAASWASIFKIE
jgi:hypothetical protein